MADRDRNLGNRLDDNLSSASSKTGRAVDKALGPHDEPATTGDVVAETTGGLAGVATGAASGSLGGLAPVSRC